MNLTPEHPMYAFVADCEELLQRHGTVQDAFVNGTYTRNAKVFDTPGLCVSQASSQGLEIEIKYLLGDRERPITNPVFCRDAKGEVYRTHGEWHYGKERVKRLLAGESPQTPIRIGKGENGWSAGLD